jgi:hypothetical protein
MIPNAPFWEISLKLFCPMMSILSHPMATIEFGITALDELGNESDMITLKAPYQFNVPKAPEDLYMQKLDDFCITRQPDDEDDRVDYYITSHQDDESDEKEPVILVEAVGSIN